MFTMLALLVIALFLLLAFIADGIGGRAGTILRGGLPERLEQYYVRHQSIPFRMAYGLYLLSDHDHDLGERSLPSGASYVSPIELMCDGDGCLTRFGDGANDITIMDDGHLTVAGSTYLVDHFSEVLLVVSETTRIC